MGNCRFLSSTPAINKRRACGCCTLEQGEECKSLCTLQCFALNEEFTNTLSPVELDCLDNTTQLPGNQTDYTIRYGNCTDAGCSFATAADPCQSMCVSFQDPCVQRECDRLIGETNPGIDCRSNILIGCACKGDDWKTHYNCIQPVPLTGGPTDSATYGSDKIKLIKVMINNEEHCVPILCDFGCDDFEFCAENQS